MVLVLVWLLVVVGCFCGGSSKVGCLLSVVGMLLVGVVGVFLVGVIIRVDVFVELIEEEYY